MTMNSNQNHAEILKCIPSIADGQIKCNCGRKIENHNKFLIEVKSCPFCDKTLKLGEEKEHIEFNSRLGRHGKHVVLKGKFQYFFLSDGLNVMYKKTVQSTRVKAY